MTTWTLLWQKKLHYQKWGISKFFYVNKEFIGSIYSITVKLNFHIMLTCYTGVHFYNLAVHDKTQVCISYVYKKLGSVTFTFLIENSYKQWQTKFYVFTVLICTWSLDKPESCSSLPIYKADMCYVAHCIRQKQT